ncbi:MAG: ribosome silencing factor [Lachnospiraceae bacterium]|nr:ribosome silencing factor [Lachnospiraceae bacterium]
MENTKELIKVVYDALEDKKAENITIIDIQNLTTIADYFVIADGTNTSQVQALVDNVEEKLAKAGERPIRIEGIKNSGWILMDYGNFVVHIFSKEDRLFYDLEQIWRDGKTISVEEL